MRIADMPEISQLSTPEKILFVEELWDSIKSNEKIPMPNSHQIELDKRFENYKKNKGPLLSLQELENRINKRK
ncbi:MAG: hypothetical protein ACD_79C00204G0002 [uncultured bacterium]|nr:MAG: hypothetical protein ACD_79C00204G0002 [uncultured bacterium]